MPNRVRLHRPDHWRDETTSRLRPDVRDAYFGLSTLADDAGFLLWRTATLAAARYPFEPTARRESDRVRRASARQAAGLLIVAGCGCAVIPRMRRDMSPRSGITTVAVGDFHVASKHPDALPTDDYVALRSAKDGDSDSVSDSESDSTSGAGSSRTRPRETAHYNGSVDVSKNGTSTSALDKAALEAGGNVATWAAREVIE
jgi:hypothetical protein